MQFRLLPHRDFLLAHLDGLVSVQAWDEVLRALGDATRSEPLDLLLVNLSGLVGWLGVPERTAVGALLATHLARMRKVALVIEAAKITGVVEAQAQRMGLDLRIFSSEDEAVAWLTA